MEVTAATGRCGLRLYDALGQLLAVLEGFELRAAPAAAFQAAQLAPDWLTTLAWAPVPLPAAGDAFAPDSWLVVGETSELQAELVGQMQQTGQPVVSAAAAGDVRSLVGALGAGCTVGVVYLGCGDGGQGQLGAAATAHALGRGLLEVAQALQVGEHSVRLTIVTQGVHAPENGLGGGVSRGLSVAAVAGGALWGMGRSIAWEQPEWRMLCVDLDASQAAVAQVVLLRDELLVGAPGEMQIAYRGGQRHSAQLMPWQAWDGGGPQRLQLEEYGSLDAVRAVAQARREPGAGEVEVAVRAAGLNFRRVLNALGLLREHYASVLGITRWQDVALGLECAGVVTTVGAGVTSLAAGDRVMGLSLGAGAFASYVTLPVEQLVAIPAGMCEEEAATIPLAFMTAWYGLVELARVQPGERVLIHAAAGGVGQAAVQICLALGAEVYATASPGKWAWWRGQGVQQIFNSRTLDFAAAVQTATGGCGVDVVLNSLNGEYIASSLAALGQGGRFVEIGKLGIWPVARMGEVRPDVTYYAFDLGEALAQEAGLQQRLWAGILEQLAGGKLHALPYTTFAACEGQRPHSALCSRHGRWGRSCFALGRRPCCRWWPMRPTW